MEAVDMIKIAAWPPDKLKTLAMRGKGAIAFPLLSISFLHRPAIFSVVGNR